MLEQLTVGHRVRTPDARFGTIVRAPADLWPGQRRYQVTVLWDEYVDGPKVTRTWADLLAATT